MDIRAARGHTYIEGDQTGRTGEGFTLGTYGNHNAKRRLLGEYYKIKT